MLILMGQGHIIEYDIFWVRQNSTAHGNINIYRNFSQQIQSFDYLLKSKTKLRSS